MRRRALAAIVLATVAAALAASEARSADECNGLMACISVPGPWVVVPGATQATRFPSARWQLKCPVGTVAGLDARLSDASIDVFFDGLLGSPVNPGITTRDRAVFTGRYTGRGTGPTSFKPYIGCIRGGGGRTPTVFRPGQPTVLRVRTARLTPGSLLRTSHGCRAGERLIAASHAVGFFTREPPAASVVAQVRVTRAVVGSRILVAASRQGVERGTNVVLQVQALCTQLRKAP